MAPKVSDQQIADLAGVSPATVSRVRNGHKKVAEDTVKRVLAAAQTLRVSMPAARTPLVGMIVPDSTNPFFSELCFRFERRLQESGVQVLISSSEEDPIKEVDIISRLRSLDARGLIYISTDSEHGGRALRELAIERDTFPTVVFDRRISSSHFDFVSVDSRAGTLQAVDHLVVHGHRKIGYLKGRAGTDTARERFESFDEAVAKNKLEVLEEWVFDGDYQHASGAACAELIMAMKPMARPTAIVAANDMMAIGLIQRLQEEGWKLPDMLSVVGFDDIKWCEWIHPALTTIAQPITQMVNAAARLILKRMRDTVTNQVSREGHEEIIQPRLRPRKSVAEPWEWGTQRLVLRRDVAGNSVPKL